MTVRASGAITVHGDVESATLEARQDITILGGMLGTARSTHGSLFCRFAQGAHLVCAKRLVILESAVHSHLTAGEELEIGDAVIGGSGYAERQVLARVVGSEGGTLTRLSAGRNRALREEADRVRNQAARLVERLGVCTKTIQDLSPVEERGEMLPIAKRVALWNAMSEKARINDQLSGLSQAKNKLIASINEDKTARVKISDRVFPPTQIEIDDVGLTIKAVTQFVTYSKDYEAGLLRMTPFT